MGRVGSLPVIAAVEVVIPQREVLPGDVVLVPDLHAIGEPVAVLVLPESLGEPLHTDRSVELPPEPIDEGHGEALE